MVYVVAHAKHLRKHDQETEGTDFSVWINMQTSGTPNKLSELPPPRLNRHISSSHRGNYPPLKKNTGNIKIKAMAAEPERIFFFP